MKKTLLLLTTLMFLTACGAPPTDDNDGKIRITTSFYPLYEFARNVGKEHIEIINITPAGAEPHDFEPTHGDLRTIQESKLFLFHGAGLDPWAEKISPELQAANISVIEMTSHFTLAETDNGFDPHIWLDPILAIQQVKIIRDALMKADRSHAANYRANAEAYIRSLTILDEKFKRTLKNCRLTESIVSHDAFGYLAKRYDLHFTPIAGAFSPEDDPSLKRLAELIEFAKKEKIKYIFFESLVSPKMAETIAREAGAQTLILNPIEGLTPEQEATGENYLTLMENNLINLRTAHDCPE